MCALQHTCTEFIKFVQVSLNSTHPFTNSFPSMTMQSAQAWNYRLKVFFFRHNFCFNIYYLNTVPEEKKTSIAAETAAC